jgi:hypothetical protein
MWRILVFLLVMAALGGWLLRPHFSQLCCASGDVGVATPSDAQVASPISKRNFGVRTPLSRNEPNPLSIYQAKSLASVESIAAAMGPDSPDALFASTTASRICNSQVNPNGKVSDVAEIYKYGGKDKVDYFVAERKRFCGNKIDEKYISPQALEDGLPGLYQTSSDPVIKQLLDIKYETSNAPQDPAQQKQTLSDILKSTQSPFELQEAGDLLSTKFGTDWTGSDIEKGFGESSESQKTALSVAVVLAGCDIFGGCGAGDWKTLQYCMPFECSQNTTVESYLRSRLSGSEFDRAQQFATQIQQWRAGP